MKMIRNMLIAGVVLVCIQLILFGVMLVYYFQG